MVSPPACIHPSRIERPTEIHGRLCLIQARAVQDQVCTSMCLSDAVQHGQIVVRRLRGIDCWSSQGYVTTAGQQGGLQTEPLCQYWKKKLHRRRLQWACPYSRCHRPQSAHGCCSKATVEVEPRPHSTRLLHVLNCTRKACWRRSLSRSVVISAHPEDQQCRLPGPTCSHDIEGHGFLCYAYPTSWKHAIHDQSGVNAAGA